MPISPGMGAPLTKTDSYGNPGSSHCHCCSCTVGVQHVTEHESAHRCGNAQHRGSPTHSLLPIRHICRLHYWFGPSTSSRELFALPIDHVGVRSDRLCVKLERVGTGWFTAC